MEEIIKNITNGEDFSIYKMCNKATCKNFKCNENHYVMRASLVTASFPKWVKESGFPVKVNGDFVILERTDWDEIHQGRINKSIWIEFCHGDINILDLESNMAKEYMLCYNGKKIGVLSDVLKNIR